MKKDAKKIVVYNVSQEMERLCNTKQNQKNAFYCYLYFADKRLYTSIFE